MKPFSKVYERIGTESAFAIGPEIRAWEKQGYDITRVNVGEPGCNIPESSTLAAIKSFQNHETHYVDSKGYESLREAVAKYMTATRDVEYNQEDVIITPGGKPIISGTMFILVEPGDEVIYPSPSYPIYESIVDLIGATGVPLPLKEEKGFRFDIEDLKKLITKKTKLLVLNSTSNPTGGVLEKKDMEEIAALARKYDFYILSDECYSRIAFGSTNKTVLFKGNKLPVTHSIVTEKGMAERTVILEAFSKTYAMTGLRIGMAVTKNREIMSKFLTFAINFWTNVPGPCMRAAEAALGTDQKEAQSEIKLYQEKRDLVVDGLNNIKGIYCHRPSGSFYLFPNVTEVVKRMRMKDAEELRKYLLTYDKKNKKGVAVLARKHFGKRLKSEKEEYIRLSFAGTIESLKEGVARIKEAVEK